MRNQMRFAFLLSLFSVTLFFTSCQKDEFVEPSGTLLTNRDPESFAYSVNPAQVGDSVTVTFDAGNGADCGQIHIQVSGPDGEGWGNGGKPVAPDSGVATLLFVPLEPGSYIVRAKYTRTGNPASCDFESTGWLIGPDTLVVEGDTSGMGEDTASCEATFTGEAISCDSMREVVYTFTPDQDLNHLRIQGGLTNGTLEDPVVTVEGADLDVTIRTPGNSSNRIITLEGTAEACVPITITITWTSSNQGDVITGDWSAGGLEVEGLECE